MKKLLTEYIYAFFILQAAFIIIRLLEFCYILIEYNNQLTLSLLIQRSINYDTLFIIGFSFLLLVPTIIIGRISLKISINFFKIIMFLLVFIHLIQTFYFLITKNILNSTIFEFSSKEISKIILSEFSSKNSIIWVVFIILTLFFYYVFFRFVSKIKLKPKKNIFLGLLYLSLGIITLINRNYTYKSIKFFNNNFEYLLGNSKQILFIKSFNSSNFQTNFNIRDLNNCILNFQNENTFNTYSNVNYPLIHNEPYNNVLGKYFTKDTIKPNIVFLICESLSSSFSGKNKLTDESLTPFIDSLSNKSLYWSNFLSNAERSYGALPNILSSLPSGIGNRGFINMDNEYNKFKKYPKHTSLIQLLKKHNYTNNYFYGGWGNFDNVENYMNENKIDNFINEDDFDNIKYHKSSNNSWGYNDKDLFSQSFDFLDKKNNLPSLNIYQTITLHSPYDLSEKEYYSTDFINKRINKLKLNPIKLKKYSNEILASIFFSDDAIRDYFNTIKNKNEYSNTIFIITGDHSLGLNNDNNIFENYRVPLIIYSQLLNKPASFKGVCSHVDILPSIVALLQENYGMSFNSSKHWIGQGLDTSKNFNANRNIPLSINSTTLPQYIKGENCIFNNTVYKFDSLFNIKNETNKKIGELTKKSFYNYKFLNNYTCLKNKIWMTTNN